MSQRPEHVLPVKCGHCQRKMDTPLFCDYCQTLHPLTGVADHFQLFGLPRRFQIDLAALHENYVRLSRHSHPDFHVSDPPEVRALSQSVSAAVNEAYRTLTDPVRRAAYLLELLGGPPSSQDKSVPEGFLGTMMMMQEEVQQARQSGNQAELARLREVLKTQHDGLMRRVAGLFGDMEAAAACEATRQQLLYELRGQLNAVAYVRKMLSQL